MASEMLQRDDLAVYVIAGLPRSFRKKLQKFVEKEAKADGELMLLDEELTEWVVARLRGEKRRSHEQTPASSALWRAYRALSAARYHMQDQPAEQRVRELRLEIEELWRSASPLHPTDDDAEGADEEGNSDLD